MPSLRCTHTHFYNIKVHFPSLLNLQGLLNELLNLIIHILTSAIDPRHLLTTYARKSLIQAVS